MHSDSRQRSTMFKTFVGALSLFVSGVASQTLDFSNLKSCEQGHIQWRGADTINPPTIPLESYTFSLSATGPGDITYTLNITNVGFEGFDFTPNWAPGTQVLIHQTSPFSSIPFLNEKPVTVKDGSSNDSCIIDVTPTSSDIVQQSPPTFIPQSESQIQCNSSSVVWTSSVPPYKIQVSNVFPTTGINASIELSGLQSNAMSLKVPFQAGRYAWVITDSNGETSNTTFPIDPSGDTSCLIMPPVFDTNEASPTLTTIDTNPTSTVSTTIMPSGSTVPVQITKATSKKSIIIAAVLGPVLGLLAVFGIGFFVYYRIRRRNREKELKMKQEVTYVPPQHARLIDVKVKPPDIE